MTRLTCRNLLIGLFVLITIVTTSVFVIAYADTQRMAENRLRKLLLAKAEPKYQQTIENYHYRASRMGTHSWLVSCANPNSQPTIPSYYLIDRDGEINLMSPESLSKVMRTEFDPNAHESNHGKFIEDFVHLLFHEGHDIIDETRINELKSDPHNPIPIDLATKIRPPERDPEGTYIIFAYQRMGGYVRRYEFHYSSTGAFLECIVSEVANRVGPYAMYE